MPKLLIIAIAAVFAACTQADPHTPPRYLIESGPMTVAEAVAQWGNERAQACLPALRFEALSHWQKGRYLPPWPPGAPCGQIIMHKNCRATDRSVIDPCVPILEHEAEHHAVAFR